MRKCACPKCQSKDVWKWGSIGYFHHWILEVFSLTRLTCRRCGANFYKRRTAVG